MVLSSIWIIICCVLPCDYNKLINYSCNLKLDLRSSSTCCSRMWMNANRSKTEIAFNFNTTHFNYSKWCVCVYASICVNSQLITPIMKLCHGNTKMTIMCPVNHLLSVFESIAYHRRTNANNQVINIGFCTILPLQFVQLIVLYAANDRMLAGLFQ